MKIQKQNEDKEDKIEAGFEFELSKFYQVCDSVVSDTLFFLPFLLLSDHFGFLTHFLSHIFYYSGYFISLPFRTQIIRFKPFRNFVFTHFVHIYFEHEQLHDQFAHLILNGIYFRHLNFIFFVVEMLGFYWQESFQDKINSLTISVRKT